LEFGNGAGLLGGGSLGAASAVSVFAEGRFFSSVSLGLVTLGTSGFVAMVTAWWTVGALGLGRFAAMAKIRFVPVVGEAVVLARTPTVF
jgi:hypothetical protein